MFMFRLEKMFVMFSTWRLFIVVYIVEKWHRSTFVDSLKGTNVVIEYNGVLDELRIVWKEFDVIGTFDCVKNGTQNFLPLFDI